MIPYGVIRCKHMAPRPNKFRDRSYQAFPGQAGAGLSRHEAVASPHGFPA